MKRLVIAGATGSIGSQALDVLAGNEELELVGLSAGTDIAALIDIAGANGVNDLAIGSEASSVGYSGNLRTGPSAAAQLVRDLQPDLVLNAVVGFAGLAVTQAGLESGADVALANKESLVAGGDLVMSLAKRQGLEIFPVDSEHASLAQLLEGVERSDVERLVLTASGGPFRGWSAEQLSSVTVEQALAHPTWKMGGKISIDSATLMNKGLELIEAHHLFQVEFDRLGVVVHAESLVHALVELVDGMQLAHLGVADMRSPIAWAVGGQMRSPLDIKRLNLASVGQLNFEEPDLVNFPSLRLALEAGKAGQGAPAVLNAANEVAVEAFLAGQLRFISIPEIVALTLERMGSVPLESFEQLHDLDSEARALAESFLPRGA